MEKEKDYPKLIGDAIDNLTQIVHEGIESGELVATGSETVVRDDEDPQQILEYVFHLEVDWQGSLAYARVPNKKSNEGLLYPPIQTRAWGSTEQGEPEETREDGTSGDQDNKEK